MSELVTSTFKRGDTFGLSGVYRLNGIAVALHSQLIRSQLRTSVGALVAELVALIDPDQISHPGRFHLSLADPARSSTFPAPAKLYCDIEVHEGGVIRSTETFIIPVIPDVSQ